MPYRRPLIVALACLSVASVVHAFATPQVAPFPSAERSPFDGKFLYLDTPDDGIYGVQENVTVTMIGENAFLVLQPFKRTAKESGAKYDEQHWVAIGSLTSIKIFDSREAAEAYERDMFPMIDEAHQREAADAQ